MNQLYYGDNLEVLRKYIRNESVDLCYIDPPFNSKRNYNQIYNNIGSEDKAQAQAFIDTWEWNSLAEEGYSQILDNYQGKFTSQIIGLIAGLKEVLGKGSLLAYLVSITLRVVENHRVLKPTGSFYLHCDPTSSHYLKLVLDSVFCAQGGDSVNEIVWCYETGGRSNNYYPRKHDTIFWYSKSKNFLFNDDAVRLPRDTSTMHEPILVDENGKSYQRNIKNGKEYRYYLDKGVLPNDYWVDIQALNPSAKERLGYPTQKPLKLLERIIKASSNEGDVVLDAYCGCGTTVAVAQKLNRDWIGIDITYQSISLIIKRLEDSYSDTILDKINLNGIPKDINSAVALANRHDDRTRKEFEKWAVLTYSNNRAVINQKKGADKGIDGFAYFLEEGHGHKKIILQVKSGNVSSRDIRDLHGTIAREGAAMGIFITLKSPTSAMQKEAKECGVYQHKVMGRSYPCIQIVTVKDILEAGKRLDIPLSLEVLRTAEKQSNNSVQLDVFSDSEAV
ncbi:DNA methyltransferase [Tolypothrix sp. NIES-4075]|uniref:DNA methyltransferase n=1 Tax=Tolypothrix sp. NIES-4075 TaxID=2005459 RepID=UPI000B5C8F96|nr:DNA methyltransferase [Tolypothrix sp. NIES-4075]GAX41306.1 DNA methyltransferase [Tolypothrix sp. NIES-4075]